MRSWTGIPELKDSYRTLGAKNFWLIMGGVLLYVGGGVWLMGMAGWPDRYGFHCRGRGCLIEDYWHSPVLLHANDGYAWALFVWFWAMPASVIVAIIYMQIKKRRDRTFL